MDVINRHVRLQPAKAVQKDYAAEALFAVEYQKVLDTIPLTPAPQVAPLRKFQFKNNTPAYVAKQQQRSTQTTQQTQTVTQVYQAVVQQNVVVQGGNVLLDVPPQVLERIAPVETRPLK